jgi:hypothetical protein
MSYKTVAKFSALGTGLTTKLSNLKLAQLTFTYPDCAPEQPKGYRARVYWVPFSFTLLSNFFVGDVLLMP